MPRLFFALWPDAAVRDALYGAAQAAHGGSGGRLMRRENLHQTLVFVGSIAAERIAGLEAAAAAVTVPAFKLEWGTAGYWRHNRIIWAAPDATPPALLSKNGWRVINVDTTIIAQAPRMAPHIAGMVANIAADLGIPARDVNVKAKTTEKLGFTGRAEGIAAEAVVLIAPAS